jgi:hypothetical protein
MQSKLTRDEKEARKLLDNLVLFLNDGSGGAAALWHILTALRGPDNPDSEQLKCFTTQRVRGIIGLEGVFAYSSRMELGPEEIRVREDFRAHSQLHFDTHFSRAIGAIRRLYGYDLLKEAICPKT